MAQFLKLLQVSIILITPAFSTLIRYKPVGQFASCEMQYRAATECYSKLLRYLEITLTNLRQGKAEKAADAFNEYTKLSFTRSCKPAWDDLRSDCKCADNSLFCPNSAELMAKFKATYDEVWYGTSVQEEVRSNWRMLLIVP